jgi:hypothetical protein
MPKVLLFARIDILDPVSREPVDAPRCIAVRTETALQPDVLQQLLVEALHREYRSWHAGPVAPAKPSLWQRWPAWLQALIKPAVIMRRKLPPARVVHGSTLAAVGRQRRRAF